MPGSETVGTFSADCKTLVGIGSMLAAWLAGTQDNNHKQMDKTRLRAKTRPWDFDMECPEQQPARGSVLSGRDAQPFKQQHVKKFGVELGKKGKRGDKKEAAADASISADKIRQTLQEEPGGPRPSLRCWLRPSIWGGIVRGVWQAGFAHGRLLMLFDVCCPLKKQINKRKRLEGNIARCQTLKGT